MSRAIVMVVVVFSALVAGWAEELITPSGVASATASTDLYPARNLINNSGLSPVPSLGTYTNLSHAAASTTTAWVTADPAPSGGDWFAEGNPNPALTFTLPQTYSLSALVVWGYHFGSPNNNEAKSFSVALSTDGGVTWSDPVALTHQRTAQNADTLGFGGGFDANAVRLTITDNHYGAAGASGGDRVGLGEVKFIGKAKPNPNPIMQTSSGIEFGSLAAHPGPQTGSIFITNAGIALPLQILSATVVGAQSAAFTVAQVPGSIPAGQTGLVEVRFDPGEAEGFFVAALEIRANDTRNPLTVLWLTAAVNRAPLAPEPPRFSVPSGTFAGTLEVSLESPIPAAGIIYTTDGSLPSRQRGLAYSGPIAVSASVQIRAVSILPGQLSAVAGRSYVRLAPDVQAYQSPLPLMIVENFGRGTIPDKGWTTATQTGAGLKQVTNQSAFIAIIDRNAASGTAAFRQNPTLTTRVGIRVRGAFSSTWYPKPYSFEAWDDADQNTNIAPLGLPKESDWNLYYPHPSYDRTMLYNTFIWELSSQTGRYGTRYRFVDVFINEDGGDLTLADRRGVYAFSEKVKRDSARIDFEPLAEDGSTGGWLLGINRMDPEPETGFPAPNGAMSPQYFHTAGPDRIQQTPPNSPVQGDDIPKQYNAFINFESPNGYLINPAQRAAIEGWFRGFEDVLFDDRRWRDPALGYRHFIDTQDFIDYFHLLNLARQSDGLLLSMYPWVSSGDRRLHMGPMWDFNNSVYDQAGNAESVLYFRQDQLWYPRLFKDPSFLRDYIDRWYALRRGPLANTNFEAIINRQSAEITPALAVAQGIASATDWTNRLNAMKSWLVKRANWLDHQFDQPPQFSAPGGRVPSGFKLTMISSVSTNDALYYTLDGADPLAATNAIPGATRYAGPLVLTNSVLVRVRSISASGQWSALNEATFFVGIPADATRLVISEIMFNPGSAQPDAEFIELLNISAIDWVDLSYIRFTQGIEFTFPLGASLGPGARTLVVLNRTAFAAVHGPGAYPIAGEFQSGRLENKGETIRLEDAAGRVIEEFAYGSRAPWPEETDGAGYSLVRIAPETSAVPSSPEQWRGSANIGGNPGGTDRLIFTGQPEADRDGNGMADLLDYAFGGTLIGQTMVPVGSVSASGLFQYSFRRNVGADDLAFVVRVSLDLVNWQTADQVGAVPSRTRVGQPPGIAWETWTIPLPAAGQRFVQVQISRR
jgi:hypothetical protein